MISPGKGFNISPSEVEQGAGHMDNLGSNLRSTTSSVSSTHDSLASSLSGDRSGCGSAVGKLLTATKGVFDRMGEEAVRVVEGSGARLRTGAQNHRTNEDDVRRGIENVHSHEPGVKPGHVVTEQPRPVAGPSTGKPFTDPKQPKGQPGGGSTTESSAGGSGKSATGGSVTFPVKGAGNEWHFKTLHAGDPGYDEKLNQKVIFKGGKFGQKFGNKNAVKPQAGGPSGHGAFSGYDVQTGKPVHFGSSNVYSVPLKNSKGETIGVSFPTKLDDKSSHDAWAAQKVPTWHDEYYPVSHDGKWQNEGNPAPWHGSQPILAHSHANENWFSVLVHGKITAVDGNTYGQILTSDHHYQAAAGANPQRPLLLLSCDAGHPGGTSGQAAADYLHSHGDNRPVYAPTGGLYTPHSGEISGLGVVHGTDSNGNPVPPGFTSFPPPVQKPGGQS